MGKIGPEPYAVLKASRQFMGEMVVDAPDLDSHVRRLRSFLAEAVWELRRWTSVVAARPRSRGREQEQ